MELPDAAARAKSVAFPVRETACGLPLASSAIVRKPVQLPLVVGANTTLKAQLTPGATVLPQVLDWEKSPVIATLEMLRLPSPVLFRVMLWLVLVVPTCWAVKFSILAERATIGMTPFPVRVID